MKDSSSDNGMQPALQSGLADRSAVTATSSNGHMDIGRRDLRDLFEREWKTNETKFRGMAIKLTRDQDLAEDVLQDTHLRGLNAFKDFRGGATFTTWMYRILTNTFLDTLKKSKRHRANISLDHPSGDEDSWHKAPLSEYSQNQKAKAI